MKTLLVFFALAFAAHADIIGFEDNALHGSDRDFNDAEYLTSGLIFHRYAPFAFTVAPGYTETPFPTPAQYFDYATAIGGEFSITYLSGQTSGLDVLQGTNDTWLTWANIGSGLTATAAAGTRIDFRLDVNGGTWSLYADPARNIDGLGYGVVSTPAAPPPPDGQVPEPGSLVLMATGVGLVGLARWRRG